MLMIMKDNLSIEKNSYILNRSKVFLFDSYLGEAYSFGYDKESEKNFYNIVISKDKKDSFFQCSVDDFRSKTVPILDLSIPIELPSQLSTNWISGPASLEVTFPLSYETEVDFCAGARLEVELDIINWNEVYSVKSFFNKYESRFNKKRNGWNGGFSRAKSNDSDLVTLGCAIFDCTKNMGEICEMLVSKFFDLIEQTQEEINVEMEGASVTRFFNFPAEIKEPCEQYLIYFSKFLEDIGINATSSIEEKVNGVLFTVKPKDSVEALSMIKNALNIYLSLPEIPDLDKYASLNNDVGVRQLVSNIHYLKSQLLLCQSMIQMKDATISALNLANYQQKVLLEEHSTASKNEEKVLNEIITINEYEGKGFKLNLPKLFRMIKRKFKR